jgi:hypothetical protein
MSKRKPAASASKHVRRPKTAAKAQRAKQAIVRSPKNSSPRSISEGTTGPPASQHDSASLVPRATAAQDDIRPVVRDNDLKTTSVFSSATANVRAYQAKLLEISQANMQFSFEFAQRIATIKSPVEFLKVIEELTRKRVAMFRQHSKEIAELVTQR